jgi:hypothetical protein
LRSHVFDGLLSSKRGTARLGTRTIQQHCINVPSKWTLSLFGWAQRPSYTPTRPSIFASKNPCPLLPAPVLACFFVDTAAGRRIRTTSTTLRRWPCSCSSCAIP